MKKSRIFLLIAILFMLIVLYVVYDMSTKTKFRKFGEETEQNKSVKDSVEQENPKEIEIRR
jgi:Tfp pilus assembly protein PilO